MLQYHLLQKPQIENHQQRLNHPISTNRTNFSSQRRRLLGKGTCPKAGLQLRGGVSSRQAYLIQAWVDGLSQVEGFSKSGSPRVNSEHIAGKSSGNVSRDGDNEDCIDGDNDCDNRLALNDSCMWGLCCQGLYPPLHVSLETSLKESATDVLILGMGKLRLRAMNELS